MRPSAPCLALLILGGTTLYFWPDHERVGPPVPQPLGLPLRVAVVEQPLESQENDLVRLRRAYGEETSNAKRLRLQGRLARRLAEDPQLDRLVSEISDHEAPLAYRSYLARVFRNEVKRDDELYAKFEQRLRQLVADSTQEFVARAEISRALIDIDASDELIGILSSLLREANSDTEAVSVIAVLARTSHPKAAKTLWEFVQSHHENCDIYPRALSAALLPLSHVEEIPLTSILNSLQDRVSDPTLLASVNRSLTARHTHRE